MVLTFELDFYVCRPCLPVWLCTALTLFLSVLIEFELWTKLLLVLSLFTSTSLDALSDAFTLCLLSVKLFLAFFI